MVRLRRLKFEVEVEVGDVLAFVSQHLGLSRLRQEQCSAIGNSFKLSRRRSPSTRNLRIEHISSSEPTPTTLSYPQTPIHSLLFFPLSASSTLTTPLLFSRVRPGGISSAHVDTLVPRGSAIKHSTAPTILHHTNSIWLQLQIKMLQSSRA